MKITYSKENINSFGRINFADHIIKNTSAFSVIDQFLGNRGPLAEYSYSDLIHSYLLLVLCRRHHRAPSERTSAGKR
jgi:ribulose kinase